MSFENKYGVVEDAQIKEFHKSRIMFAIYNNKLYISDPTEDSHAEWFKKKDWITDVDDSLMDIIIRGYVDNSGIYFYRGYNFIATKNDEEVMLSKLSEIQEILDLKPDLFVYAGVIKLANVKKYPPKKVLGLLSDLLLNPEN